MAFAISSGIRGKVVAITGATDGIGAATARLLGLQGAHVMLGDGDGERLTALAAELRRGGASVGHLGVDVTDRRAMQRFISTAHAWFGRLDVIVNAAGASLPSRIDALRTEDWRHMVDVNLHGVLHAAAAGLSLLQSQGHGQIVNFAAEPGTVAGLAVHEATQAAVRALSLGLQRELGGAGGHRGPGGGIRVCVIDPEDGAEAVARVIAEAAEPPMRRAGRVWLEGLTVAIH